MKELKNKNWGGKRKNSGRKKENNIKFSLYLNKDLFNKISLKAKELNKSKSDIINYLIEKGLNNSDIKM